MSPVCVPWFSARELVIEVDEILDANVSDLYKQQPLAQHWARVAKAGEEAGEAVDALIVWTGQNPRKSARAEAYDDLLNELADTALTGIYALQHFTKDAGETAAVLISRLELHASRLRAANSQPNPASRATEREDAPAREGAGS